MFKDLSRFYKAIQPINMNLIINLLQVSLIKAISVMNS